MSVGTCGIGLVTDFCTHMILSLFLVFFDYIVKVRTDWRDRLAVIYPRCRQASWDGTSEKSAAVGKIDPLPPSRLSEFCHFLFVPFQHDGSNGKALQRGNEGKEGENKQHVPVIRQLHGG